MDRTAALQKIRQAREAKGLSYDDLGRAIGTKNTMYIAAALHGQHRLNAEEAKKLAEALGIESETAMATTAMPLRTEFPLTTDPFKYRLMELVGVYGDALRELLQRAVGRRHPVGHRLRGDTREEGRARRHHDRREVPPLQGVLGRPAGAPRAVRLRPARAAAPVLPSARKGATP